MRIEQLKTYKPKVLPFGEDLGGAFLQAAIADTLLTTTQLDSLRSIAQLCPYTYGTAVYSARALVNYYDNINTHYVNECEQTTTQQAQNRRFNTSESDSFIISEQITNTVVVSPNPSTGNLYIELVSFKENENQNIKQIRITDVLGREVRRYNGNETKRINIEKTGLTKGIYIIQTQLVNGNTQCTKWLIQEN